MIGRWRRSAGCGISTPDAGAVQDAAPTRTHAGEPTLDELFAEPIVRRLMRRDGIDETTTRHLLQQAAASRVCRGRAGVYGPRRIVRLMLPTRQRFEQIRANTWLKLMSILTG
jgi:phenylalanyl-tRNA synthetase beta subunit